MRISVIMGSPRKRDTYRICKEIESNFTQDDLEFDYIYLNEYNIKDCKGCDLCFKKSEKLCPCDDDLSVIQSKLIQSNGIVFASPVYAYQVPGAMKRLIDRLSYLFHRQVFVGVPAVLVVSSEGGGHNQVSKYLHMTATGWGCDVVGQISLISPMYFEDAKANSAWGYNEGYALKKKAELSKICSAFQESVLSKTLKVPSYKSIFMFNCLRSKTYTSQADHDYWKEKGWLDSDYFYESELRIVKRVFSKVMKSGIDLASRRIANRIT